MSAVSDKFKAVRNGLLTHLVLRIIAANKSCMADVLRRLDETEFKTRDGTLYPLLNKMHREGLLEYDWRETGSGPPRKYYRLTTGGRDELREYDAYWERVSATLRNIGRGK